jgi:hypothetical protein
MIFFFQVLAFHLALICVCVCVVLLSLLRLDLLFFSFFNWDQIQAAPCRFTPVSSSISNSTPPSLPKGNKRPERKRERKRETSRETFVSMCVFVFRVWGIQILSFKKKVFLLFLSLSLCASLQFVMTSCRCCTEPCV